MAIALAAVFELCSQVEQLSFAASARLPGSLGSDAADTANGSHGEPEVRQALPRPAWGLLERVELVECSMIFRQLTHDDLGCASCLIGDEDAGIAAVVDPKIEIEEYDLGRYMGVRVEHVLETHNHGDHVSGHGRLAAATGARIHVHRLAAPDYEHEPFDDGW